MDFLRCFCTGFDGGFSKFNLIEQADKRAFVFLQSCLVDRLLVNGPGLPAFPDDALPFVGQGPHGGVVLGTLGSLLKVIGRGPAAVQDRFLGVFVETLLQEFRAKVSATCDRNDPGR